MRIRIAVACLLLAASTPVLADISIGIGLPSVQIGINLPMYPDLEPVPGYPVYYAPGQSSNLFFYDGLYWVYSNDQWYSSDWYNGPWDWVGPEDVPLFILRVPVRYYRQPPQFFVGWSSAASPRWGEHWGRDWERRRSGWDQWDRRSMPRAAPAPIYQRNFSGNRYPSPDQQRRVRSENYGYKPQDAAARRQFEKPARPEQQKPGAGRDGGDRHDAAPARADAGKQGAPADRARTESRDSSRPDSTSHERPSVERTNRPLAQPPRQAPPAAAPVERRSAPPDAASQRRESAPTQREAPQAQSKPPQRDTRPAAPAPAERRTAQPDASPQRRQSAPTQREAPQAQSQPPQRDTQRARPQESRDSGAADGKRQERKRESDQPRER